MLLGFCHKLIHGCATTDGFFGYDDTRELGFNPIPDVARQIICLNYERKSEGRKGYSS